MTETNLQYTYRRIKAVFIREWRLILLTAVLGAVLATGLNLLIRKGPRFRAHIYMMQTNREKEVSVLAEQIPAPRENQSSPIDVLSLRIRFPDFYVGLRDTALMYEVLAGRISGITALRPGVYTEKSPGVVKCPCSKRFKVVVYDTLGLWRRLTKGRIRVLEDEKERPLIGPKSVTFFTLEYESPDRRWARRAVEVVSKWIIKKHLEEKKQHLIRQRNTIAKLMEFYRGEIDTFARQIQQFKERMRYPELTEEKVLSIMGDLKGREMALKNLRELLLSSPKDTVFVDVGDPVINDLQRERINLVLEIRAEEATRGKAHPGMRALERRLNEVNALILRSAEKSLKYVREQLDYYRSILPVVLKEQARLLTIQRNLENAEDFYIVLGQKLNDTDVQLGSLVPDISVLGEPVVRKVGIYSRSRFAAALGFLIGLIFGVAMAFFRDMTTDVVLDEEILPFPQDRIVTLPTFSRFDTLPYQMVMSNDLDSTSPALNEFRKLLFKLGMFDDLKEIIAITSTQTGEGKTFVSANLAAAAALSGVPVLLIDGDIRARGLSELFNLANAEGYANGRYEPYQIHPYLYVLPVGETNEDHLLVFRRMLTHVKDLLERFRVILDLPPVTVSPEIKLLEHFAVKYILVLRYNYTRRSYLKHIDLIPDLVIFNQVGKAAQYYARYYSRYGKRKEGFWDRMVSSFRRGKRRKGPNVRSLS